MNKVINLFDSQICVQCKKPCHFGSGRFVNRYPYDDGDVEGWVCGFCDSENQAMMEEESPTDYLPSDVEPK